MKLLIENIHKSFGSNDVLKGADEVFQAGQIYALLGRNGSGKTTLFDIIAQKKKTDDGQVLLERFKIRKRDEKWIYFYPRSHLF